MVHSLIVCVFIHVCTHIILCDPQPDEKENLSQECIDSKENKEIHSVEDKDEDPKDVSTSDHSILNDFCSRMYAQERIRTNAGRGRAYNSHRHLVYRAEFLNDTKNRTSGHVQNHSVMMTYTLNVQASSNEF